jgi:uncharacterized membrane protein
MMGFIIVYVAFCWLLGHLGRNTKFSFAGNFWVSVILTPVIGLIVLLAQDSRPDKRKNDLKNKSP